MPPQIDLSILDGLHFIHRVAHNWHNTGLTETFTFNLIANVLGGLAIFLLGMKYMSEGMQAIAGDRLRKIIRAITDNRLMACGAGFGATCIVQSSSVTTVMVVGMVSAGLMTLTQSIGVILGADIGTTITAWIVAMDVFVKGGVLIFGLPLIGISGFFYLFSKNEKVRFAAMMVMGLGMVFFGLYLMKAGVKPIRSMPEFQEWFSKITPDTLLGIFGCVAVGAILTGVVQSSSATVGITMVLAKDGIINMETALALVIGENIGTTITAFLASLGTSRNAKRAAYAHILIKFAGALWAIPALWLGMKALLSVLGPESLMELSVIETPGDGAMLGIAIFHTAFNILNVSIFLPLVAVLSRFLMRIVPEKPGAEAEHLTYLDVGLLATPAVGIQQSHDEIVRMAETVEEMLGDLAVLLKADKIEDQDAKSILKREERLDGVQREVVTFLSSLLSGTVAHDVMDRGRIQLRLADEYESISDYVARIVKMHRKLQRNDGRLTEQSMKRIFELHDRVVAYVARINEAVRKGETIVMGDAKTEADQITDSMKSFRDEHLENFAREQASPLSSLAFTDTLTAYRRIRSHTLNIAQAIARE